MLWKYFLEFYQEELYQLWYNWIPKKENKEKNELEPKSYFIKNPYYEHGYDYYNEEYIDNGEEEFIELVDYGDRVLSFEDFVSCAYENSML